MASRAVSEVTNDTSEPGNTTRPTNPPILRFSREMRDHIYRFLLHPDEIRREPTTSNRVFKHWKECFEENTTAHTYRYRTNILAVNKTIHAEAKKYLHKHSTFARVLLCSEHLPLLYGVGVPIISEGHLQNFEEHSLDVVLEFPSCFLAEVDSWISCINEEKEKPLSSILMLTQDLPVLRDMFKIFCSPNWAQVPYIFKDLPPTGKYTKTLVKAVTGLALEYRATKHKTLSQIEQRTILDLFKTLTGAGYSLQILGFEDEQLVKATMQAMAPMVVWLAAQNWDHLEACIALKRRADHFALSGNLEAARALYSFILTKLVIPGFSRYNESLTNIDQNLGLIQQLEQRLTSDIYVTRGWLDWRVGDLSNVTEALEEFTTMRLKDNLNTTHASALHLHLYRYIDSFDDVSLQNQTIVAKGLSNMCSYPSIYSDSYVQYDCALFQEAMEKHKRTGIWDLPREKLSAYALPVRTFDSWSDGKVPLPKEGTLVGWQDKEQLKALTDAQKEQILALHGQPGYEMATKLCQEGRQTFDDQVSICPPYSSWA